MSKREITWYGRSSRTEVGDRCGERYIREWNARAKLCLLILWTEKEKLMGQVPMQIAG